MKKIIVSCLLAAAFAALPVLVSAQPSAHYVPGVEGIKGASLPPPGVYAKDYNVFYYADRVNDEDGNRDTSSKPDLFIYANVPRLIWITDVKILGGFLGLDALVPLQYTDLEVKVPGVGKVFDESTFAAGDLFAEATLSWHVEQADFAVGYGVWAPTGRSSTTDPTLPGAGYWTHMFTAGMTWYMDNEKKWALSGLCRYEINHERRNWDFTPGQAFTVEWGASYALRKTVDVGVAGYYQQQVTKNSGSDSPSPHKDNVVGIGPEIVMFCPSMKLFVSLRYNIEVLAQDRAQGHTGCLTLTKIF